MTVIVKKKKQKTTSSFQTMAKFRSIGKSKLWKHTEFKESNLTTACLEW